MFLTTENSTVESFCLTFLVLNKEFTLELNPSRQFTCHFVATQEMQTHRIMVEICYYPTASVMVNVMLDMG